MGGIITTMKTQTIKIWKTTLKKLRMLYALTGKSMVSIMEHMVTLELGRVRQEQAVMEPVVLGARGRKELTRETVVNTKEM